MGFRGSDANDNCSSGVPTKRGFQDFRESRISEGNELLVSVLAQLRNDLRQVEQTLINVLPLSLSVLDLRVQMIIPRLFQRWILVMNAYVLASRQIDKIHQTLLAQ